MCGISAIVGKNKQDKKELEEILLPIIHRGEKKYFNESEDLGNCVLGMNRLAIVDEEGGKQPMKSSDGRFHIVLNGEIYNYRELRNELEKEGYSFKTDSDTEVLVNGYSHWKEKVLDMINGMFAFFVFDSQEDSFFVARDPFGIKPLYFAKVEDRYYFASEIKSLIGIDKIKEIQLFPPSHFMKDGELQRYYDFPRQIDEDISEEEAVERIRELFDEAVKKRVQTHLPIAVYLSGGIDSTAVLVTALKYHSDITAIIVGNQNSSDRETAIKYCEENDIKYIAEEPPAEEELVKDIPSIIKVTESFEPNMIRQSAISYHIAKTAKDFKIILCGEGADELFAGYPEFKELKNNKEIEEKRVSFLSDLHRTQLQRVDRTSMAFTTEVRVPFLDKDLVSYGLKLSGNLNIKKVENEIITKYILRKAMEGLLPKYIYNREKVVLSEGAGYKGNQKIGGLFYDLVSKEVSDEEFEKYKTDHSDWNLETKEEVYYFKYYLEFGYDKAKFNQKRTMVNKIDSVLDNKKLTKEIIRGFNTWKFKREQPNTEEKLFNNILNQITNKKPIRFIMYWGKGEKNIANESDILALEYLKELFKPIKEGIKIIFIFTDTHAELNGYSKNEIKKYYDSVDTLIKKYDIDSLYLSKLVEYNEKDLLDKVDDLEIDSDLLEILENSSRKHNKRLSDHNLSAKLYYLQNQIEKKTLEENFSNSIFLTYNGSSMDSIFPTKLPIFYMYSIKRGTSTKPWFSEDNK